MENFPYAPTEKSICYLQKRNLKVGKSAMVSMILTGMTDLMLYIIFQKEIKLLKYSKNSKEKPCREYSFMQGLNHLCHLSLDFPLQCDLSI